MNDENRFDITRSLENMLSKIFGYLPEIFSALVILLVGYLIAKMLGSVVRKALARARFDRALHTSPAGNTIARVVESPSRFVGTAAFWLVFLAFVSLAVGALNWPILNDLLRSIYGYVPRVISAVVIFLVAGAVSTAAVTFVQRVMGRTATAKLISTVIPAVTMSIATFMILNQLQIAPEIVNILFTGIVAAMSLGLALAFGLGGRDIARDLLQQAYDKSQQNMGRVREDMQMATENTRREAENIKRSM